MEGSARFQIELPSGPDVRSAGDGRYSPPAVWRRVRKAFTKFGWGLVALGVLLALMSTLVEGESETLGVLGGLAAFALAGGVIVLLIALFDAVLDRTFDWGLDRLGLRGRRFGWSGARSER
jgi:hypothetical protein